MDYADVDWAAFIKARKPGSSGIFRVYGVEDTFYEYAFQDKKKYLELRLYDKARETMAYGYIVRNSVDGRELQGTLKLWEQRQREKISGPVGAGLFERIMMSESENPQKMLKAMQAIRELPEVESDADDLFGDKNFIKPEL